MCAYASILAGTRVLLLSEFRAGTPVLQTPAVFCKRNRAPWRLSEDPTIWPVSALSLREILDRESGNAGKQEYLLLVTSQNRY